METLLLNVFMFTHFYECLCYQTLWHKESKFKQRTALSRAGETRTQHTVAVNCTDVHAVT